MARNHEKQLGQLNRFLVAKQLDLKPEKEKKRPLLSKLSTAEDIRQWIPSIQGELKYCVEQLSGKRNYSAQKLKEFEERIEELREENDRFLKKCNRLDPFSCGKMGLKQGYISSNKRKSMDTSNNSISKHKVMNMPLAPQTGVVSHSDHDKKQKPFISEKPNCRPSLPGLQSLLMYESDDSEDN